VHECLAIRQAHAEVVVRHARFAQRCIGVDVVLEFDVVLRAFGAEGYLGVDREGVRDRADLF
jgi:hypothetical protein